MCSSSSPFHSSREPCYFCCTAEKQRRPVQASQTPGSSETQRGTHCLPLRGPGLIGTLRGVVKKLVMILRKSAVALRQHPGHHPLCRDSEKGESVAGHLAGTEPGDGREGVRRGSCALLSLSEEPSHHKQWHLLALQASLQFSDGRATPGSEGEPGLDSAHWLWLSFRSHSPPAFIHSHTHLCMQVPAAEQAPRCPATRLK